MEIWQESYEQMVDSLNKELDKTTFENIFESWDFFINPDAKALWLKWWNKDVYDLYADIQGFGWFDLSDESIQNWKEAWKATWMIWAGVLSGIACVATLPISGPLMMAAATWSIVWTVSTWVWIMMYPQWYDTAWDMALDVVSDFAFNSILWAIWWWVWGSLSKNLTTELLVAELSKKGMTFASKEAAEEVAKSMIAQNVTSYTTREMVTTIGAKEAGKKIFKVYWTNLAVDGTDFGIWTYAEYLRQKHIVWRQNLNLMDMYKQWLVMAAAWRLGSKAAEKAKLNGYVFDKLHNKETVDVEDQITFWDQIRNLWWDINWDKVIFDDIEISFTNAKLLYSTWVLQNIKTFFNEEGTITPDIMKQIASESNQIKQRYEKTGIYIDTDSNELRILNISQISNTDFWDLAKLLINDFQNWQTRSSIDWTDISTQQGLNNYLSKLNWLEGNQKLWYKEVSEFISNNKNRSIEDFNEKFVSEKIIPDLLTKNDLPLVSIVQELHMFQMLGSKNNLEIIIKFGEWVAWKLRTEHVLYLDYTPPNSEVIKTCMVKLWETFQKTDIDLQKSKIENPQEVYEKQVLQVAAYYYSQFTALQPMWDWNKRANRSLYKFIIMKYLGKDSPYIKLPLVEKVKDWKPTLVLEKKLLDSAQSFSTGYEKAPNGHKTRIAKMEDDLMKLSQFKWTKEEKNAEIDRLQKEFEETWEISDNNAWVNSTIATAQLNRYNNLNNILNDRNTLNFAERIIELHSDWN